jgi:DNA-binding response OmpR family regulator
MALPPGNVLIVDDDANTRQMLAALLSTQGFHAVGAEDGLEALHMLRAVRHRAPDVPCLVLLDLMMPRLSGSEFRRAQLRDPIVANVPVAVMSGATDVVERSRHLGAVAIITKPIDFDVLLDVVRRYCACVPVRDISGPGH